MKVKNVTVNFRCPEKVRDSFQKIYPFTMTRFLVNAMRLALNDRDFFQRVYFDETFKNYED